MKHQSLLTLQQLPIHLPTNPETGVWLSPQQLTQMLQKHGCTNLTPTAIEHQLQQANYPLQQQGNQTRYKIEFDLNINHHHHTTNQIHPHQHTANSHTIHLHPPDYLDYSPIYIGLIFLLAIINLLLTFKILFL